MSEYESNKPIDVPEISISYAVTVCNELEEIKELLPVLYKNKKPQDEIVVLLDKPKAPPELIDLLYRYSSADHITLRESSFNGNFADWKNELTSMCKGNYIYQIDADEMVDPIIFDNLHWILKMNSEVDIFLVPRINIVNNLGLSWIKKWGWNCYKIEDRIQEKVFHLEDPKDQDEYDLLEYYHWIISGEVIEGKHKTWNIKFYTPRVNGHDFQWRIYKNNGKIKWKNAVHEVLEGYDKYSFLPTDIGFDLIHIKSLEKQIKQNLFYESIH